MNLLKKNLIKVKLMDLKKDDISDVMTEVLEAEYICVGSPTLNNGMLPTVAAFLTYLKGLAPKKRKAIAFGSYGWGGQSIGEIAAVLEKIGCEFVVDPIRIAYIPDPEEFEKIQKEVEEKI